MKEIREERAITVLRIKLRFRESSVSSRLKLIQRISAREIFNPVFLENEISREKNDFVHFPLIFPRRITLSPLEALVTPSKFVTEAGLPWRLNIHKRNKIFLFD